MPKIIKHQGIVAGIESAILKVKITQTSACAACSAKGMCHASEQKEKCIDIPFIPEQSQYQIGDSVTIMGKESMGLKAVLLAFVLPFCILITALAIILHLFPGREAEAALASMACLIPYYLILYAFREKVGRAFTFELEQ